MCNAKHRFSDCKFKSQDRDTVGSRREENEVGGRNGEGVV